jgi:hypothetical protein
MIINIVKILLILLMEVELKKSTSNNNRVSDLDN